ncbi:MAG TPA: hypothetical protein PLD46_07305 [Hyphomicrobium sp.]|nr:hypothetical protein [Hyphomicrobium sp.]
MRKSRALAIWLVAALSAATTLWLLNAYWRTQNTNDLIAKLVNGEDIPVDAKSAPDTLIIASINELIRRDRFDEAQALANSASARMSPRVHAKALYNLANSRTRRAIALVGNGDLDGATALVNVAKGEYRLALRVAPDDWDAKYNLDVAMRMVRDLPVGDNHPEEVPPDAPKRVWTDLPGVPKGLP